MDAVLGDYDNGNLDIDWYDAIDIQPSRMSDSNNNVIIQLFQQPEQMMTSDTVIFLKSYGEQCWKPQFISYGVNNHNKKND